MWRRALAVLAFLLTAVPPALAGDGRTELLAGSCAPCHGADGNSQGASIPSLAGQPQDYFIRAMQAFRKGERAATVMDRLARAYDDADLEAMGHYFATVKPVPQTENPPPALLKKGAKLAYEHCRTCHVDGRLWRQFHENRAYDKTCSNGCHLNYGPDGKEEVPVIGGQWPAYLELQMEDFQQGRRPMSERKAKALRSLSRDDLPALAAFYASLKEPRR